MGQVAKNVQNGNVVIREGLSILIVAQKTVRGKGTINGHDELANAV
jgi:hypothetical protein